MPEYKVSPGPWSIEHTVDDEGNNIWWVNTQYVEPAVAKCFNPAHAQIISSIPDMYEALEKANEAIRYTLSVCMSRTREESELEEAREYVDRALAKARGEGDGEK